MGDGGGNVRGQGYQAGYSDPARVPGLDDLGVAMGVRPGSESVRGNVKRRRVD